MLLGGKVTFERAQQAYPQKDRADDHVKTMKPSRHVKVGAIDVSSKAKGGVAVFIGLANREKDPQHDRQRQTVDHIFAVIFMHQRMMGPSGGHPRTQQNQRVDQRQMPWIKRFDTNGRPHAVNGRAVWPHRVHGMFEKAPEPSREKHDF